MVPQVHQKEQTPFEIKMKSEKPQGWYLEEVVGMSILNPRSSFRIPVPPGLSPEELRKIDELVDEFNSKEDP